MVKLKGTSLSHHMMYLRRVTSSMTFGMTTRECNNMPQINILVRYFAIITGCHPRSTCANQSTIVNSHQLRTIHRLSYGARYYAGIWRPYYHIATYVAQTHGVIWFKCQTLAIFSDTSAKHRTESPRGLHCMQSSEKIILTLRQWLIPSI